MQKTSGGAKAPTRRAFPLLLAPKHVFPHDSTKQTASFA